MKLNWKPVDPRTDQPPTQRIVSLLWQYSGTIGPLSANQNGYASAHIALRPYSTSYVYGRGQTLQYGQLTQNYADPTTGSGSYIDSSPITGAGTIASPKSITIEFNSTVTNDAEARSGGPSDQSSAYASAATVGVVQNSIVAN